MSKGKKVVCILSGGIDSTTLLYSLVNAGYKFPQYDVYALTFDYGQRHKREINCAIETCEKLGVKHKVVDITNINTLLQGSALTDESVDVPEGHYEDESMKSTFVPNRNMILLSLAIGYAVSIKAKEVYYGAHAGDVAIYPDCSPKFIDKMNNVARVANYEPIKIRAPYMLMGKGFIIKEGIRLKVDFNQTWTCYNPKGDKACGKCGSCSERLESFGKNNITDPIEYDFSRENE